METGRLARAGLVCSLVLAVVACSGNTTTSPAAVATGTRPAAPSPSSSPSQTVSVSASALVTLSPSPTPAASPPPMAPATLRSGPAMTMAREDPAAVRLEDGRVLIMGGTVPFVGKCAMACIEPTTSSVEVYDPRTGKFSRNGSLAAARSYGQALLLSDGRVFLSGGRGEYGDWLRTIEIYDPAEGRSVVIKPPTDMGSMTGDPTLVLLADGRVLIVGGADESYTSTSKATLIFDPASGGFSKGPDMAESREGAKATLLYDGRVLIVAGYYYVGGIGSTNNNVELIDVSNPLAGSSAALYQDPATSTRLYDGRVLVAGGGSYSSGANCITPAVPEVFDPAKEMFTPVGRMATQRTGSAAIKIQDGRVIFFGGLDANCEAVTTVEAFDPDTGTFQVVAQGFPKLSDFSVTLLNDGEILIAGGTGVQWNGMTSASWLLKP